MTAPVYLNELGIICALGSGKTTVQRNMLTGEAPGMGCYTSPISGKTVFAGRVMDDLPEIPAALSALTSRNSRLLQAALRQIQDTIAVALRRYSAKRIGVVIGTSTSGVAETELALVALKAGGSFPPDYDYRCQEIGAAADFVAEYLGLEGPAYGISTACSSSGKAFASARGLIAHDLCDAVIVGGADSLCELTLKGFRSLDAMADECCNPFSSNRSGINVGEAAAVFLMSRDASGVRLAGVGESSDAHHMSAPDPSGEGARRAMQAALAEAKLDTSEIGYINLHGTATRLNDGMESHAIYALLGGTVPASSTKTLTGHTLGAAGALEAGLCWLLLQGDDPHLVIPHRYDGQYDPAFDKITLTESSVCKRAVNHVMSNSFAFGGSNVSLILSRLTNV